MNLFPSTPLPDVPLSVTPQFRTLKTDFQSGKENRRKIWAFPKRKVALTYRTISQTEIETLWQFYTQQEGSFQPFWYIFLYSENHTGEYVGVGNGSLTIFELPSKNTNSGTLVVYVDGIVTPATFLSGGGDAGVDRIQFDATGSIVSSSIASPTVITTSAAHGLTTGNKLTISGHTGSTPDINGPHTITVTGSTTFTIPVNVTVGGTGGTWAINAPTLGDYITADLEGELRLRCRFSEDEITKERFAYQLYNTGIELLEARI